MRIPTTMPLRQPSFGSARFGAVLLAALALAGPASAAPLTSATFSFALGSLPGGTFAGVGATGTATSQLSASLGAGTGTVFNGAFTTTTPTSAAPPISGIQVVITKNAGGTFTGLTPSQVGGFLAIEGVYNLDGIGGFPGGGPPLLAVPIKVGTPNTLFKSSGGISLTAIAAGWTAGTAVVAGITTFTTPSSMTNPSGSATAMGANALSPGGAGTLVLVTPLRVVTNVAGALAGFGVLTLTYVPEPGTALLLGLGVAGLAALGRRQL